MPYQLIQESVASSDPAFPFGAVATVLGALIGLGGLILIFFLNKGRDRKNQRKELQRQKYEQLTVAYQSLGAWAENLMPDPNDPTRHAPPPSAAMAVVQDMNTDALQKIYALEHLRMRVEGSDAWRSEYFTILSDFRRIQKEDLAQREAALT